MQGGCKLVSGVSAAEQIHTFLTEPGQIRGMEDHMPSALSRFGEWARRCREVLVWTVGAVVGLVVAITWVGHGHAGPIRAAEAAAREQLSDPALTIQKGVVLSSGHTLLVCGLTSDASARPVAAEVRKLRILAMNPADLFRYRVRKLAIGDARPLSYSETDLLRRCRESPLRHLLTEIP
jgi:hypothetical protein